MIWHAWIRGLCVAHGRGLNGLRTDAMGAPFRIYLASTRVYTCSSCGTHLAADEHVMNRNFNGRIGRAYLFGASRSTPLVLSLYPKRWRMCSDPG